jgi:transcriptional regulator with XRE-family HTH domain
LYILGLGFKDKLIISNRAYFACYLIESKGMKDHSTRSGDMQYVLENIRKIREIKGLTREDAAERMGLSLSGYSKLERGEVDWTLKKLGQIAAVFDLPVDRLFDTHLETSMLHRPRSKGTSNALEGLAASVQHQRHWDAWEQDVQRLKDDLADLRERLERRG